MLAAPIVTQVDNKTNTTIKEIWIPPGNWIQYFTLKPVSGPLNLSLIVGLADLPLYVKAGAIIPLKTMDSVTNYTPDPLQFAIFPGGENGNTFYYEDDGLSQDYLVRHQSFLFSFLLLFSYFIFQNGAYSFTTVDYSYQGSTYNVLIFFSFRFISFFNIWVIR